MKLLKMFFVLLCLFSVEKSIAQYEKMTQKEFLALQQLNEAVSLDKNFDYALVQFGVLHYTNIYRTQKRIKGLEYNKALGASASLHCHQMQQYHFFAHINRKNKSLRDLDDRADRAGYKNYEELSENLYYGW